MTDNRDPRTSAIIGAALEVHRQLGCGFLESVYHHAMALELAMQGVRFEREVEFPVRYKGVPLPVCYRADFVCCDDVIVEIKALARLSGHDQSQVLNYLKASGCKVGLLINFGAISLEWRRLVWTHHPERGPSGLQ